MNRKGLSCLTALALVLALAFSAGAVCSRAFLLDVIPPQGDRFDFDEPASDVSQDADPWGEVFSQQIERVDISDELASILAEATGVPTESAEDETMILYGAAEVPEAYSLPDVDVEQVESAQKSLVKPILVCLVIGAVIALIVVLAVKSGYKPVHRRRDAAEYLVDGSLNVTASNESFVRSERNERTIENKSSSGE